MKQLEEALAAVRANDPNGPVSRFCAAVVDHLKTQKQPAPKKPAAKKKGAR